MSAVQAESWTAAASAASPETALRPSRPVHLLSFFLMFDHGHAVSSRTVGGVRPRGFRHALAWALLLGAMLLGIVTMHTLGHMTGDHHGATAMSTSPTMTDYQANTPDAHAHGVSSDRRHAATGRDSSHPSRQGAGMFLDPTVVCLAVLVAAGLFVALRRLTWRFEPTPCARRGLLRPSSRADPRGPPGFGLPIVRVAVLRI